MRLKKGALGKPEVGLLQKTEEIRTVSLEGSFFVGDKV